MHVPLAHTESFHVVDKGILVVTGCFHAAVVNASKHSVELGNGTPLYARRNIGRLPPRRRRGGADRKHSAGPESSGCERTTCRPLHWLEG